MSRFPTEGDLISWAGLCPKNDESAGKRRSTRMKKGAPWLKTTLVQIHTWLGTLSLRLFGALVCFITRSTLAYQPLRSVFISVEIAADRDFVTPVSEPF
jgi:hypothetical protein